MVQVVLPSVLAEQAEGGKRFDIEAETVGEALCALPVADLLFDERGEWNTYLNVYVDGTDARERGGIRARSRAPAKYGSSPTSPAVRGSGYLPRRS